MKNEVKIFKMNFKHLQFAQKKNAPKVAPFSQSFKSIGIKF